MMSIRIDATTAARLAEISARRGLTRSDVVRMAIERFIANETREDPFQVLMEVRAQYRVEGGKRADKAERHSELLKQRLRAKHRG